MLVTDPDIRRKLEEMAASLSTQPSLREDLLQEALIHLWRLERKRPGQETSWYLQSCWFRLRHCLASGRSIDSMKRRGAQVLIPGADQVRGDFLDNVRATNSTFEETCTRDLIFTVSLGLTPRERAVLDCLVDGLRPSEIAKRLRLSHPTVTKDRRKIGRLVLRLRIGPGA